MISYLDGKILAWPDAFSAEECELVAGRFEWRKHGVVRSASIAGEIGLLARERMPGAPELAWTEEITISILNTPWHLDEPRGATHKLCLYLDPGGVGTVFRTEHHFFCPPGTQGTLVLFDIRLEHRTGDAPRARRRVLGLRARLHA